ncbi:unnamed protein product [Alopecurus aequalis]
MAEEVPEEAQWVMAQWIMGTLTEEALFVDDIIFRCEAALATLQEASATLLQEPGNAAETIYGDVFEVVPPGLDPPLLGPAARLVDALFNGPGPLAGAIAVAGDLVHDNFSVALPEGGPLQAAVLDLGYLIHVPHANAGHLFAAYTRALGFIPDEGTRQLWRFNHVLADTQARVALVWLMSALMESLAADFALGLCRGEWEEHPPWERIEAAELRLHQTISRVEGALVTLRDLRDNLVELEQTLYQALPPP